jgi:hypothetical protein
VRLSRCTHKWPIVSFNRWVCTVSVDGENLADWIKENKLTKADLCPEELN